ncbi:MAG: 2-nitropropane dioxygenase [Rhodospirillaceae bacterium]|nr:2-nitropropane dioxygenase [Rhodospirillaceae bacterium]
MLNTAFTEKFGIQHPIALGGMGSIYSIELVTAVSEAGGLGALGCHRLTPEDVNAAVKLIRKQTEKPFALNFLVFDIIEESYQTALHEKPAVISFAWPRPEQDIKMYIERAKNMGCLVTFMAGGVPEATAAAEAGADLIIAQGAEGGGHVGWMGSLVLTPMIVDAVAPLPVLTAGGIADGRGLAAALSLGAQGALLGTRFLASKQSPLHSNYKDAILLGNGHDTTLTEIPDIAQGIVWPGAMSRAKRNSFIERWAGQEWKLRQRQKEAHEILLKARKTGDIENGNLSMGQDAGLINDIADAGEIVQRISVEAETIMNRRVQDFVS